jgi:hypothetical protein
MSEIIGASWYYVLPIRQLQVESGSSSSMKTFRPASGSDRLPDDIIDIAIAGALEIAPFHSVCWSDSVVKRLSMTVWHHLCSMGFIIEHLQLVPQPHRPISKVNGFAFRLRSSPCSNPRSTADRDIFRQEINHDYILVSTVNRCGCLPTLHRRQDQRR